MWSNPLCCTERNPISALRHGENSQGTSAISVAEELGNCNDDYLLLSRLVYGVVLHEDSVLHHAHIVRRKARFGALLNLSEWIPKQITENTEPNALIQEISRKIDECRIR